MTSVLEAAEAEAPATAYVPAVAAASAAVSPVPAEPDTRQLVALGAMWFMTLLVGMALVIYGFGPFFQQRQQHHLMRAFRADTRRAANEATGLKGVSVPTKAPELGTDVASIEIGSIRMQQVVVEGVGASQTRRGPGHVPGTSGPGQPGNSVIIGRRTAFGAVFSALHKVASGDRILITTTQGQSVYDVTTVRKADLSRSASVDRVYGPSKDDRLTLITESGRSPFDHSHALVVVARMDGTPFQPTPQGGRRGSDLGTRGDRDALAATLIALVAYGVVMAGSIVLYRRLRSRAAYLLTIAPVLALTVICAETLSRLLPAWV